MARWGPPDGTTPVFVGSYTPAHEPGIHVLVLEKGGRLQRAGAVTGVANPSFVAVHPDRTHFYAVSETGLASDGVGGAVVSYRLDIDDAGGCSPTLTGRQPTGGDHPCHLAVHPSGAWLVASNYGSGSFAVFPIGADGGVLGRVATTGHEGSGHDPQRQEAPHVHSSVFSPDGCRLLVADLGIDRVVIYEFDVVTGGVEGIAALDTGQGTGPRHMKFHPDGRHLFVVNELSNSVAVAHYDATNAVLDLVGVASTVPVDCEGNTAADIAISSDGATVFVSNRGHDSIAAFRFDLDRGLTSLGAWGSGGSWPRGFGLAEDHGVLVVANQRSNAVAVLDVAGPTAGRILDRMSINAPACAVIG